MNDFSFFVLLVVYSFRTDNVCVFIHSDEKNLIGMDQEVRKTMLSSSSMVDIDQLCQLIDQNKIGLKINFTSKFSSIPLAQIKIFRSSRLKRLHSSPSSTSKSNENDSSLLIQFRSLSTSRQSPSPPPPPEKDQLPVNSCNVAELTSYFEHFLNLPKALSSAAELMYT